MRQVGATGDFWALRALSAVVLSTTYRADTMSSAYKSHKSTRGKRYGCFSGLNVVNSKL